MPKKPLAVNASTVLATKGSPPAVAGASLQRSQRPSATLVDLNFKVPAEFRRRFKRLAVDADLKNVQLLRRAVEAYERANESTSTLPTWPEARHPASKALYLRPAPPATDSD